MTHTVNNDQRRVPLAIQSTSGLNSYTLAIPSNPGIVLPGYYMLFALNAQGVPSIAADSVHVAEGFFPRCGARLDPGASDMCSGGHGGARDLASSVPN